MFDRLAGVSRPMGQSDLDLRDEIFRCLVHKDRLRDDHFIGQSFQNIEADLANVTAAHRSEVKELEDALSAPKTNGRLYTFGIVIALAGLVLVFLRSSRKKPTISIP